MNYLLSNKAQLDLIEIWDYTVRTWSHSQAKRYYAQLTESFDLISKKSEIGKDYTEVKKGLLGINVGKHIVFYQIEKESSILIIRVLHERMELETRLKE